MQEQQVAEVNRLAVSVAAATSETQRDLERVGGARQVSGHPQVSGVAVSTRRFQAEVALIGDGRCPVVAEQRLAVPSSDLQGERLRDERRADYVGKFQRLRVGERRFEVWDGLVGVTRKDQRAGQPSGEVGGVRIRDSGVEAGQRLAQPAVRLLESPEAAQRITGNPDQPGRLPGPGRFGRRWPAAGIRPHSSWRSP
ncbi:MAG: hypothetical protein ACR2JO_02800 [Mycobacteriales bacterium]